MPKLSRFMILGACLALLTMAHFQPAHAQEPNPTTTAALSLETPVPIQAVITATPGEDGSLVHVVDYGQTLVQIAESYGIKLRELLDLNGLDSKSVIYPGEKLTIRVGATLTPTSTVTQTPTRTPRPTSTPRPPAATATQTSIPTITPTPTAAPLFQLPPLGLNRQTVGLGLVAASSLGLVLTGVFLFRKR